MTALQRPLVDPTPEKVRAFIDAVPLYRDDVDDPMFWTDAQLQERRDTLLARQIGWLAEASTYYQKVFADGGIDPASIRTTDDLTRLPVTTKADLMGDPQAFRLRFPQPGLYDLTYATVYTTGTTTGRPTPYEYTTHDFLGVLLCGKRTYKTAALVPGDLFLTAFPLSPLPHVSGFANAIANAAGLAFMHGMSGIPYGEFPVHRPASALADIIEQSRPQAVAGIGSYLRRMAVDARAAGRDFSSIKVVVASGEVLTGKMRAHLRENLAACGATDVFISGTYGFTEGGVAWTPCHEGGPLHACAPDQAFLEVLDPDTHARLPDGEQGLVALTHLNRRGMPLVRYVLGDLSTLRRGPCPQCGRNGESLLVSSGSAHVTRTSELMKIKGTLVNPQVIHEVVMNTPGVVEYQLVVANAVEGDAMSPDRLLVRIGLEDAVDRDAWDVDQVRQAILHNTEVRPDVEIVDDLSAIYDPNTEFKARRIVDTRAPLD